MVRTQIYLTEEEKAGLIESASHDRRDTVLDHAAGLWENREDLPDFYAARSSWDRG